MYWLVIELVLDSYLLWNPHELDAEKQLLPFRERLLLTIFGLQNYYYVRFKVT